MIDGTALDVIEEQDARTAAGDDWTFTERAGVIVAVRVEQPWTPPAARAGQKQPFRSWAEAAVFMRAWRRGDDERHARAVEAAAR